MAYGDFKDLPRKTASEKVLNKLLVVVTLKDQYIKHFSITMFI